MKQSPALCVILACCGILATLGCAESQTLPATNKGSHASPVEIAEPLPPPRVPEEWESDQDKEIARLVHELEEQRKRVMRIDQQLWETVSKRRVSSANPSSAAQAATPDQLTYVWLEDLQKRIAQFLWYPDAARMNGWEGRVLVQLLVRENGEFIAARVVKSSGYKLLDANAIDTVKRACPAKLRQPLNKPVVLVAIPLIYRLEGGQSNK
jgi:TonB family protein